MRLKKILLSFLSIIIIVFSVATFVLFNTSSNLSETSDTVDNTTTDTIIDNSDLLNYVKINEDKINSDNPTNILIDYMKENNIDSITKTNVLD
ncbi:MAG: hypothetical protein ACRC2K_13665 [Clostridium sp.]